MQSNLVSLSEIQLNKCLPGPASNLIHFLSARHKKQSPASLPGKSSSQPGEIKPLALVVDDAPDLAEMLSLFLTHAGYDVVTANSASAAIEAAQENRFDVIISDIGMPRMNGYELAQALRELPEYDSVPMIAVTGFSMYDDRERSLKSGFNAHVTKPIDPVSLFELIKQLRG